MTLSKPANQAVAAEHTDKRTDLLTPRELANEFCRILDKREQSRQKEEQESVQLPTFV